MILFFSFLELLVSSAKADFTLQDAAKNTALHLACSKVGIAMSESSTYKPSSGAFHDEVKRLSRKALSFTTEYTFGISHRDMKPVPC